MYFYFSTGREGYLCLPYVYKCVVIFPSFMIYKFRTGCVLRWVIWSWKSVQIRIRLDIDTLVLIGCVFFDALLLARLLLFWPEKRSKMSTYDWNVNVECGIAHGNIVLCVKIVLKLLSIGYNRNIVWLKNHLQYILYLKRCDRKLTILRKGKRSFVREKYFLVYHNYSTTRLVQSISKTHAGQFNLNQMFFMH